MLLLLLQIQLLLHRNFICNIVFIKEKVYIICSELLNNIPIFKWYNYIWDKNSISHKLTYSFIEQNNLNIYKCPFVIFDEYERSSILKLIQYFDVSNGGYKFDYLYDSIKKYRLLNKL